MIQALVTVWLLGCAGFGVYAGYQCYGADYNPFDAVMGFLYGSFFAILASGMVIGTVLLVTGQLGPINWMED